MENVHDDLGVKHVWFSFERNIWQIWKKKSYKKRN